MIILRIKDRGMNWPELERNGSGWKNVEFLGKAGEEKQLLQFDGDIGMIELLSGIRNH